MLYLLWVVLVALGTPENSYLRNPTPFTDARFEHRELASSDGTAVRVALRKGPQEDAPAVLYFMGNAGSRAVFARDLEALLVLPVSLVVMGYRGGEGDENAPSEPALKADASAVLAGLDDLLSGAPREIHLVGYSMGAGLALHLAAEKDLSSVLLKAPVTRICDLVARMTLTPQCYVPFAEKWDNLRLAREVEEPVLMVHGDRDQMFQSGFERLAQAFPGGPPKRIIYPDTGHNDFSQTSLHEDMADWLGGDWALHKSE